MSRLAERMAARIKRDLDIDVVPEIHRTYAGYHQKSSGTWSWSMECLNSGGMVGCALSATECVKAKNWQVLNWGVADIEITWSNTGE